MAGNLASKVLYYTLIVFYFLAGINHFIHPTFYLGLIPDYFPFPKLLNIISGSMEIIFSILMFFHQTKRLASYGIIFLLFLFIPSHIYFISIGSCVSQSLCIDSWISWLRLIVIHPLLIIWVWYVGLKIR